MFGIIPWLHKHILLSFFYSNDALHINELSHIYFREWFVAHVCLVIIVPRSGSYEIAWVSSHCVWVFFYLVIFFLFCPLPLNFNWLNIFHLIFRICSYYKTKILYLFFFVLARVDWCAILIAHQLLWQNMEAPVSVFQESPLAGEPRQRLFHIHSVNRYQLRIKYLYPSMLLWQIHGCNL